MEVIRVGQEIQHILLNAQVLDYKNDTEVPKYFCQADVEEFLALKLISDFQSPKKETSSYTENPELSQASRPIFVPAS